MDSSIKINWSWFFLSIFVYPFTDLIASFIITTLMPKAVEFSAVRFFGIFLGAFLVVIVSKKSTMWDATFGIIVFSILASFLNKDFVFSPLVLLISLLLGFLGAWLGQSIKIKK